MAFGQQVGPPASTKQVQELLGLLHDAGHTDFRDARGPLGFTQRQASGRFTRDEIAGFLDALRAAGDDEGPPTPAAAPAEPFTVGSVRRMPAELLAAELRRRGWTVVGP